MRLEILIGMIASGKSTYARHRADQGALVICHDDEPVTLSEGFDSIVNVPVADIVKWAAEPNPFPAYLPPREVADAGR